MVETTEQLFQIAYEEANKLYRGEIDKNAAIRNIVQAGWSEGNAKMTFKIFDCLMNGDAYKLSMPIPQTRVFLDNIYRDYKCLGLEMALKSVKAYLDYFKKRDGRENTGIKNVYEEYIRFLKENC